MTDNWTSKIIRHWLNEKVKLNLGATIQAITDVEKELGFTFPNDFKELYLKVDGFKNWDWLPNMFSIWPLERILTEYKADRKKKSICFADYLINSHQIGFMKNLKGVFIISENPEHIVDTFAEVIDLINSDSEKIY